MFNQNLMNNAKGFLRGFAQIMLQDSALTGVLFLIGIGIGSFTLLVGTLLGALSGMVSAKLLRYNSQEIDQGWYGFNAALIGMAVFYFYVPSLITMVFIIFGGGLSSLIMNFMLGHIHKFPPYTAPFVISAWLVLCLASLLDLPRASLSNDLLESDTWLIVLRGIGQIMFQANWVVGVIFLLGLAIQARSAALFAMIGSALGLLTARSVGFPEDSATFGLYGFNASLVAIALTAKFGRNHVPIFIGMILSVFITRAFQLTFIPSLTAPFVLASWFVIAGWNYMPKRQAPKNN